MTTKEEIIFKKDTKVFTALSKLKRYCKHCGHSEVFLKHSKRDKIICSYCGNYIYRDDLIEFKEKLKKCQKNY